MQEILRSYLNTILESPVANTKRVSGGSINEAAVLTLTSGKNYFVKWNPGARADMFETEAKGLQLLDEAESGLVIPEVLIQDTVPDTNISFLVITYLQPQQTSNTFFKNFGIELARLHENKSEWYGLDHDNFIGRLPQDNTQASNWIDFFIERRLRPQFESAVDDAQLPFTLNQNFERLLEILPDLLPDEKPSLLHGDLWSGNFLCISGDKAAVVDPAVYYGNREIELSFTKLFGGFDRSFYEAYDEALPLQPGFEERVDIYNLYPLLVHVNMFGRAYASQVQAILQDF